MLLSDFIFGKTNAQPPTGKLMVSSCSHLLLMLQGSCSHYSGFLFFSLKGSVCLSDKVVCLAQLTRVSTLVNNLITSMRRQNGFVFGTGANQ